MALATGEGAHAFACKEKEEAPKTVTQRPELQCFERLRFLLTRACKSDACDEQRKEDGQSHPVSWMRQEKADGFR